MEKYTGSAQGLGGEITVALTVDNNKLVDVTVTGEDETKNIGGKALAALAKQILNAGSADIDGVSGASITSKGAKEAAQAAFQKMTNPTVNKKTKEIKNGKYTGTGKGFWGEESVAVTIKDKKIEDVKVIKSTDRPTTLTSVAINAVPKRIIKAQSYNVDATTGATFTSNAIKTAVKEALTKAGDASSFSKRVKRQANKQEDVVTDVLVIGAGGAGLMAAASAYSKNLNKEASGVKVTLIEKNDFVSGSTGVSAGVLFKYNTDAEGMYRGEKKLLLAHNKYGKINTDLLKNEVDIINPTLKKLEKLGLKMNVMELGMDLNEVPGYQQFAPEEGDTDPGPYRGYEFIKVMRRYLRDTDIDLRLHTSATKFLINKKGEVCGAQVDHFGCKYNILAKKVIMASGGFVQNPDMIKKLTPEYAGTIPFSFASNTGEVMQSAINIGAQPIKGSMIGTVGTDSIEGPIPDFAFTFTLGPDIALEVNSRGERWNNETIDDVAKYEALVKQPKQIAWGIIDSNHPDVEVLANSTSKYVYQADTIEELAQKLNLPVDHLKTTIALNNAMIKLGEDTQFGVPVEKMHTLNQGPFYAYLMKPMALSSMTGLKVNGNLQVEDKSGNAIPNLYATGDNVLGGNLATTYVGSHGVSTALYTGALAGEIVKNAVLNSNDSDYSYDLKSEEKTDATSGASKKDNF